MRHYVVDLLAGVLIVGGAVWLHFGLRSLRGDLRARANPNLRLILYIFEETLIYPGKLTMTFFAPLALFVSGLILLLSILGVF